MRSELTDSFMPTLDDGEGKESNKDEEDDDDEMDYEGSTQELLANVDCLLTTDGGNGSQVR